MKKRKIMATLLAGSMLVGLLAGCSVGGQSELLTSTDGVVYCEDKNPDSGESTKSSDLAKGDEAAKGSVSGSIETGSVGSTPVISEPVVDEDALWTFSYNMLKENISETNPVLSPMSAYLAMGMVGLGAKGDTLTEFENVMGKGMQTISGDLMQKLPTWILDTREVPKSVLNVANAVWVDETMNPDEVWLKNVSEIYAAEAYRGVLSSNAIKNDINKWVEKKTNSLIKEFLEETLDA